MPLTDPAIRNAKPRERPYKLGDAGGLFLLATNRGYTWAALRLVLADYPILLAQVPDRPGGVDALPLGVAKVAVLKDKRVARQGGFTGARPLSPVTP